MRLEKRRFYSDGIELVGTFYIPDDITRAKLPLIIPCSGYTGLNSIHPARFARYFTNKSLICFGFDYRGFGESDGRRGRVLIGEQVRDIRHAVSFATNDLRVDPEKVLLLGWGLGGGLILQAALSLMNLSALCAINGLYSGIRFLKRHLTQQEFAFFQAKIESERRNHAISGTYHYVDPFSIYPMDECTTGYVDSVLREVPKYETDICFDFAESLLNFMPELYAPILRYPLFLAHGTCNKLHAPEEAIKLFSQYAGPKELLWLEDAGHTEWMDDNDPIFTELAETIYFWFRNTIVCV